MLRTQILDPRRMQRLQRGAEVRDLRLRVEPAELPRVREAQVRLF